MGRESTTQSLTIKPPRRQGTPPNQTHKIHLWVGLAAAIFLTLAGGTGALLAFREPIDLYLNQNLTKVTPNGTRLPLNVLVRQVEAEHPGYHSVQLNLPEAADREADLILEGGDHRILALAVNPYTGQVLGDLDRANQFMDVVLRLHKSLLLGGGDAGAKLAGFALLALAISGIVIWRKRRSLVVTKGASPLLTALNLHSALGIYAVAFLLVFAFTGVFPRGIGMTRPPRFSEPPHPVDATVLTADELLAAAQKAVPGATPVWLDLRWQPRHGGTVVGFRYPDDHTEQGRTLVHLDPWSGSVLHVMSTQQMSKFRRFAVLWDMQIHSGTILGWPTRVIAAISGLVLPVMAATGPMIWWMRRKKRQGHEESRACESTTEAIA